MNSMNTFEPDSQPPIKIRQIFRDDPVNVEGNGKLIGFSFQCGRAELFFGTSLDNPPHIYAFGTDSLPLDEVEQDVPTVLALLLHPQVRQAIARHRAGLPLDLPLDGADSQ